MNLPFTLDAMTCAAQHSKSASTFKTYGFVGFLLSFVQCMLFTKHSGLSTLTLLGITGSIILTFFGLTMITRIVVGRELIIYYHHEIAVIAAAALFLRLTQQPVMPYLEFTAMGLGLFLACGRLGCLSVGCCHGRPCRWGVRYGEEHVRTGFAPWLQGVRLFPVQALESLWVLCIVVTGGVWIWRGSMPGTVFAFYIVAYAFGRFFLEFLRGDEGRPYLLGFSEAQWTSVILIAGVVFAERWHLLPAQSFPLPTLGLLVVTSVGVIVFRQTHNPFSHLLFSAKHINEIARSLVFLSNPRVSSPENPQLPGSLPIHIVETSQGLQISIGRVRRLNRSVIHFAVSRRTPPLSPRDAKSLAKLLAHCSGSANPFDIVPTSGGVYHFLAAENRFGPNSVQFKRVVASHVSD